MSSTQDPIDLEDADDNEATQQDVEMDEQGGHPDDTAEAADTNGNGNGNGNGEDPPSEPNRITFLDYLKSPIVQLVCGSADGSGERQTLHAHQLLLVESPYLAEKIAEFGEDTTTRTIKLEDEDLASVASFVEYLYRKDYFPALLQSQRLEADPTVEEKDDQGTALLRHARIYTLAQKFKVPALATLAHKKIHLTSSSAKGEISYARYIYGHTKPTDTAIRKPVASFWATRSHVLRHTAEVEFRSMCLELPEFAFDVLQMVLDAREKSTRDGSTGHTGSSQSGRKRPRISQA